MIYFIFIYNLNNIVFPHHCKMNEIIIAEMKNEGLIVMK